tara:strand:+ start:1533 stop:1775 length:243 start_codon:yes stop_codon:yes gene_type:complete
MIQSKTSTLIREEKDTLITDWIFSEEVQQILGISRRTLYKYVEQGYLPFSKPTGGRLYFRRSDVFNLISSRMSQNGKQMS